VYCAEFSDSDDIAIGYSSCMEVGDTGRRRRRGGLGDRDIGLGLLGRIPTNYSSRLVGISFHASAKHPAILFLTAADPPGKEARLGNF